MIFKSLEHHPVRTPNQAVVELEGGADEVLHLRAFGKDLKISVRLDDDNTAVVIMTPAGLHRHSLEPVNLPNGGYPVSSADCDHQPQGS